jgi:hypothetical protein
MKAKRIDDNDKEENGEEDKVKNKVPVLILHHDNESAHMALMAL